MHRMRCSLTRIFKRRSKQTLRMCCSGRLLVLPQQSIRYNLSKLLWDAAAPADSVDAVKAPYALVALAYV